MKRPARTIAIASMALLAAAPARAAMSFSFKVPSLSGGTLSHEGFKGKILVVDVWATWCGPCRLVIPHLVALQEKMKGSGVAVVGLNADQDAESGPVRDAVSRFVREHGINYPVGLMNAAAYEELGRVMGFDQEEGFSLPTTIVLARDGTIMKRYPGYFPGQEREIEKLINRMLEAEKQAASPARP